MITLPARPSLEQLKKQAKELLEAQRSQQPEAVRLFAELHPLKDGEVRAFALHDAQLVLARRYGFSGWAKLKEEVGRLTTDFADRARRFVIDGAGAAPYVEYADMASVEVADVIHAALAGRVS